MRRHRALPRHRRAQQLRHRPGDRGQWRAADAVRLPMGTTREEGSPMMPRPRARLHVDADLAEGARVELDAAQAHYLRNVLRLARADPWALFNGRDGEWGAMIDDQTNRSAPLCCRAQLRLQPPDPDPWQLF